MSVRAVLVASAFALSTGCHKEAATFVPSTSPVPENPMRTDFENICNAIQRSGAASVADPAQRAMHVADWLNAHVHTADARRSLNALGSVGPAERAVILRQAAVEAGYTGPCPMADAR